MAEAEEPVESQIRIELTGIARAIEEFLQERYPEQKMGFFVAMYLHNEPGRFNYISNSERSGIIKLLEEMIVKFKGS